MFSEENIVMNNIFAGGLAGIINMSIIHSPKTIIKYQYVNNTSINDTIKKLVLNDDKRKYLSSNARTNYLENFALDNHKNYYKKLKELNI